VSAWHLLLFASFSIGAILTVAWPLALIQHCLRQRSKDRWAARLAVGATEGLLIVYLVCIRSQYASIDLQERKLLAVGIVCACSAALALAPRLPRLTKLACLGVGAGALLIEGWLPFRQNPLVHLALGLIAGACFISVAAHALDPISALAKRVICAVALALVLLAPYTVRASMSVRGLLYDMSSHARVHASVTGRWLAAPRSRRRLGALACTTRTVPACEEFRASDDTPAAGSLIGADVLMLTIDAVRADQVDAFPLLRAELGAPIQFTRAVSPATRTSQSFKAMLRGRPLRQARRVRKSERRRLSKTLGAVLREQGYRAVTVATHQVLSESSKVATGFDYLRPADPERLRGSGKRLAFASAASAVLEAAHKTDVPMLAWLHALETHAPYNWQGGVGPANQEGQRIAQRDLDPILAQFIRQFRAARAGRPLVIAVFSDHGEEFGEHGGAFHSSTVYAEQAQVMFLLSVPGLTADPVTAPVSTAALPATLLSLLGLNIPCEFTLPSLLPCIERGVACPKLAVTELEPFGANRRTLVGYTSAHHRLLYDRTHDVLRLFDSRTDPLEQRNLVHTERALRIQLERQARAWDRRMCVAKNDPKLASGDDTPSTN
jgi:arylsulfatase A-like enzyme